MEIFVKVLVATLGSSLASLLGGVILVWQGKKAKQISLLLVAIAAGAMIATAISDLLPEAIELAGEEIDRATNGVLAGFTAFFLIERFLLWFHHHHTHDEPGLSPTKILLVLGDSLHNFIDGLIIAGSFMANPALGVLSAISVGLHEVPQEIADFAAMLHLGMKPFRVFLVNLLSALASVLGGIAGIYWLSADEKTLVPFLGIAAGSFIYIAASDLIPELHVGKNKKEAIKQVIAFGLGVGLMLFFGNIFGHHE